MQRAAIILNPISRNSPPPERLAAAAASLRDRGWEIDLRITEAPGHARLLAEEAVAAGARVVFSCGGDGTLNEVVNGVVGSETAVSPMRAGMGNVFAKEIGVPRQFEKALNVLLSGETHKFDLGLANGRYFLVMSGVGFDASVVQKVPAGPKRTLGSTSYVLWALPELLHYKPRPAQLRIQELELKADLYWLLVGNTRSYGGVMNITNAAIADDGLLDAYVFAGDGPVWLTKTSLRLMAGRQDGGEGVLFNRIRELEVTTPGLPLQADGEYIGETPVRYEVAPRALNVLLPPGRARHLLSATQKPDYR